VTEDRDTPSQFALDVGAPPLESFGRVGMGKHLEGKSLTTFSIPPPYLSMNLLIVPKKFEIGIQHRFQCQLAYRLAPTHANRGRVCAHAKRNMDACCPQPVKKLPTGFAWPRNQLMLRTVTQA
jgi:hypothetical protein